MNNLIITNHLIINNSLSTKYIIEDELDFATELNNYMGQDNTVDTCLISQQPLTRSHITLPCNHKFNYMSLFKEVCNQKQKNMYEVCHLKQHQLKCPYCRKVVEHLLPYIASECVEKKHGVNYPCKYAMAMPTSIKCDWVYKTKTKDITTPVQSCQHTVQYITEEQCYCKQHYLKATAVKSATPVTPVKPVTTVKPVKPAKEYVQTIEWTADMEKIYKTHSINDFKKLLRLNKLKVSGNKRELAERLFTNNVVIVPA